MKGISLSFIVKVLAIILSILIFSYGIYSLYNVAKINNNNVTFLSKKIDSLVIETIILNNLNKKYDSLNIENYMNKILLILLFPVCIYGQLKVKDDIALVDMSTLKILNEKLEYGSHCKNTLILLQEEIDSYSKNNLVKDSITIVFQKKLFETQKYNMNLLDENFKLDLKNQELIDNNIALKKDIKKEKLKYNITKMICIAGFSFIIGNVLF